MASFLHSSLRAEGVAIPGKQNSKIKVQSEEGKNKSKVKDQNEEGFYILICHSDFSCLIFDILL